jgi:hypothetical protein
MPHPVQCFGLNQSELSTPISARTPVPLQAIVRLSHYPLHSFRRAIALAYDVN